MIRIYNNETGAYIGIIGEDHLQFLIDHLEEESLEDKDYYLNKTTLDMLEKQGADATLVGMLRKALGDKEGVEIRWTRS